MKKEGKKKDWKRNMICEMGKERLRPIPLQKMSGKHISPSSTRVLEWILYFIRGSKWRIQFLSTGLSNVAYKVCIVIIITLCNKYNNHRPCTVFCALSHC